MSIRLTEDQAELKALIGSFMENEVKPQLRELDEKGDFPVALYKKAFDLGFHCLAIPEEYGGSGCDHTTMGILLEEIGHTDPGFAITILCTALALECVLIGGNEAQKKKVCDIIVPGGFGSFCLTEPGNGSDSVAMRTTYRRDGDSFVLNGSKCFVTNGQEAGVFIVFATKDRSLGAKGISAFIVEPGTPGLAVGKHEDKMGLRLSNTTDVALTDVRIPAENLLGEEGKGMRIALAGLDQGRLNNAAIATGICQAALDAAVDYAKQRESFGVPIIRHQAIQMMLADMAIQTEAARLLVYNGMQALDAGQRVSKEASMAKTFCGDSAVKVATDAVQVLGGYGYSKEYPVEKMMRDSKIFQIFEGTNQIQRVVIARTLEKE
ncbi:MAG: acyl-CoA dehydrogenase family protein [Christensenella sp.]|uniref:acyl-CoA dehydrogenase family protein n=1 Tax=Christensenella sp. TaxID=1935934 RepID=UPI002B212BAE|nr:acyl-CoA dehydrogenase family protein [Christensenella sp.]MEA5002519.1 acyl-CoA dehydrogenase family protein [Christensenella sp.]